MIIWQPTQQKRAHVIVKQKLNVNGIYAAFGCCVQKGNQRKRKRAHEKHEPK